MNKTSKNREYRADKKEPYNKEVLIKIARELKELENSLQSYEDIAETLRQPFEFAQRAIRQFTALETMIIVNCGMLKAGKSTLINLLARSEMASPVGFGIDTTLRPALVRMGKEKDGRIHSYYAQGGADKLKDALLQVLDELRGVELGKPAAFDEESVPLTQQNLLDFLCGRVPSGLLKREPLLVVVELPYRPDKPCLLSGNCMLLDMPGLDSANAELSIEEYAEVVAQCDMMFYVQSSVSPLNDTAKKLLQQVLSQRHADTTYIIQNCMMAQMWRQPEMQKKAQERQAQQARKEIIECFGDGETSEKRVTSHTMNLGMAYDALVEDESVLHTDGVMPDMQHITAKLLAELSMFTNFENNVMRDMHEHGLRYRVHHCVDELTRCLADIRRKINEHIVGKLRKDEEKTRADWKAWGKVKQELEDLQNNTELTSLALNAFLSDDAKKRLRLVLESAHEPLYDKEDRKYRSLKNPGKKSKGSVLDKFLDDCSEEMAKKLEELVNACSLEDVMLPHGQTLLSFLNENLCNMVFKHCEPSPEKGNVLPLYQKIGTYAKAQYVYQRSQTLGEEYQKKQFERLSPSDVDGRGYPFTQDRKFLFWESKSCNEQAHKVRKQLIADYLDVARKYIDEHVQELQRTLFENGKKRGLRIPLDYVKSQEETIRRNHAVLAQQIEELNKCISGFVSLENKTKEI